MRDITKVNIKIATKADKCTGVRSFISKNIIEAMDVYLWNESNTNDKMLA